MSRTIFTRWPTTALCGVAVVLVLHAALTGCGKSSSGPVTSRTSQYQVADDAQAKPQPAVPAAPAPAASATPSSASPAAAQRRPANPVAPAPSATADNSIPARGAAADSSAPVQPPAVASDKLDTLAVPDGTPEQLMEFIAKIDRGLAQLQVEGLPGRSKEQIVQHVRSMLQTRLAAADKILAAQLDDQVRAEATMTKLVTLANLADLAEPSDRPQAMEQVRGYCKTLMADKNPAISRQGRVALFQFQVAEFLNGRNPDPVPLMKDLKALLADEGRDDTVMDAAQQAVIVLQRVGAQDAANDALRAISDAFLNHSDPQLAASALDMHQYLELQKLQFDEKRLAALRGEPGAVEAFLQVVKQALAQPQPGEQLMRSVMAAALMMESTGQYQTASQMCEMVRATYPQQPDNQLAKLAEQLMSNPLKRLALIAKPLSIAGVLADGSPFDANRLQGKVVLFYFWVAKRHENQQLASIYQKFHDRGFEIVGMALDGNQELARGLPWTTIYSAQDQDNPLARSCGVDVSILPFTILMDQQGIVTDLHLHGTRLESKLAEMLGPPAAPNGAPKAPTGKSSLRSRNPVSSTQPWVGLEPATFEDPPAAAPQHSPSRPTPAGATDTTQDEANPYLPPADASPAALAEFILEMQEKPRSIQSRPGFAEGIIAAADRVLEAKTKDSFQILAARAKFAVLHRQATSGNGPADEQLWQFVQRMKGDSRPEIAADVQFFEWEHRMLEAEKVPVDQINSVLSELDKWLQTQKLTDRHLRLASGTVALINRLEDGDQREKDFQQFGKLFAASSDKQLAAYGRKLGKPAGAAETPFVGRPMELAGVTASGVEFDWTAYRGKVVLVDFWATWCGPCREEMPHVRALYDKLHENGFEVVGVNLDKKAEDVATFFRENPIPWTNLVGDDTQKVAEKYGVRAIPQLMLVDQHGTIVAAAHQVSQLEAEIEKLLQPAAK